MNEKILCSEWGAILNDEIMNEFNGQFYCSECFEKLRETSIKSYNYKPEPIFYGSGDLFLGVELEIDKGGEIYDDLNGLEF